MNYRSSPLSTEGKPGPRPWPRVRPRAGDRLPDMTVTCDGRRVRLHELLAPPGIHVLLEHEANPPGPLGALITVHRLTSVPGRGLTAVRPDGYIGLRCPQAEAGLLLAWLARVRPL